MRIEGAFLAGGFAPLRAYCEEFTMPSDIELKIEATAFTPRVFGQERLFEMHLRRHSKIRLKNRG
jgi:hypothetical protein